MAYKRVYARSLVREVVMKPGARVEVVAQDLDESGLGVGSARDMEVCAANWLPGERALIEVEHMSPHRPRAWGRLIDQVGPASPHRTQPICPAFGQCGGCVWQHLAYPAQLELKHRRVKSALGSAGIHATVEPVLAAPAITHYRNVGKYVAGASGQRFLLGAYAQRTHRIVDLAGCRIVEPVIDRVRGLACRVLGAIPVYDEKTRTGLLRYVVIRAGSHGRALVGLVTTSQAPAALMAQVSAVLATDADVSGVVRVRNDATTGAILTGEVEPLAGEPTIPEIVAGVRIDLGIMDFFQVNRAQAERLYAEVTTLARGAERIMDVYSGVGGIAFALAMAGRRQPGPLARATRILGIERNPSAVAAANRAAERASLALDLRFMAGRSADLPGLALTHLGPAQADLIVVNPPRKGLDHDTLAALRVLTPPRIIYVSCGPESLARDLARLPGYRIERIQPVDLMPGTSQIETVCGLTRT